MRPVILRSVLIASDLSEASDAAVRAGAALAAATGAELHLLHVIRHPRRASPAAPSVAESALAKQLHRADPAATAASTVAGGWPVDRAILARAADVDADLIVLGPHRRRPLGDSLLGSTAERVVGAARIPCLVVSGPLRLPLRRLVSAVDFSGPSLDAVAAAVSWGAALHREDGDTGLPETELRLLRVLPRILDETDLRDGALLGPGLDVRIAQVVASTSGRSHVEVREEMLWGETRRRRSSAISAARGRTCSSWGPTASDRSRGR